MPAPRGPSPRSLREALALTRGRRPSSRPPGRSDPRPPMPRKPCWPLVAFRQDLQLGGGGVVHAPVLPVGLLFVHCVRPTLCPGGVGRVLGRRIERRPPTRLRVRPSRPERRADPRCPPPSHKALGRGQRLHPPLWPLGTRTLRRHGPRPPGRSGPHPPMLRKPCCSPSALLGHSLSGRASNSRAGVSFMRRCHGWPSAPPTAGPGRASRAGVSLAPTERCLQGRGTARGPGADRPVRSRPEEHAGSGAGAPVPASGHPWDRQARGLTQ